MKNNKLLEKAARLAPAYNGPLDLEANPFKATVERQVTVAHFPSWSFIQAANEASGLFWFSEETRRFFGTRIHGDFGNGVFTTSEKAGFNKSERIFSVRLADEAGQIYTWNSFGHFDTVGKANTAARRLSALLGDGFTVQDEKGQAFTLDLPGKLEAARADLKKWHRIRDEVCKQRIAASDDSPTAAEFESSFQYYSNGISRIESQLADIQAVFNRKAARFA